MIMKHRTLASIIKTRRVIKNYTQNEFAKAIGMNGQQYHNFERGRNNLPPKYMKKLSEVAEMDIKLMIDFMVEDYKKTLEKEVEL